MDKAVEERCQQRRETAVASTLFSLFESQSDKDPQSDAIPSHQGSRKRTHLQAGDLSNNAVEENSSKRKRIVLDNKDDALMSDDEKASKKEASDLILPCVEAEVVVGEVFSLDSEDDGEDVAMSDDEKASKKEASDSILPCVEAEVVVGEVLPLDSEDDGEGEDVAMSGEEDDSEYKAVSPAF